MRIISCLAGVLLACVSMAPTAFAAGQTDLQLDDVRSQQAEIRAGAKAGTGIYENLSPARRSELFSKQDRMLGIIAGKRTAAELDENQLTEVFNALEWIEAAVNQTEDQRLVCERRDILGSNRKERVCRTVAQMRVEREAARERMERRGVCDTNCGF